jgi:hypothetical protein
LFAQHRIRNAVPERLQAANVIRPDRFIEYLPRNLYYAARGMHQAFINRRHPVGMTAAAGALSIGKFAGKSNQSIVRAGLKSRLVITGMAGDATSRCKGMCRAKTVLLVRMTLQAITAF